MNDFWFHGYDLYQTNITKGDIRWLRLGIITWPSQSRKDLPMDIPLDSVAVHRSWRRARKGNNVVIVMSYHWNKHNMMIVRMK